jgi:predicted double-glycine peptidase
MWLMVVLAGLSAVSVDVPFVRQEKNGCGPASLAMLVQYWMRQDASIRAEDGDAASIYRELYSAEAKGVYASAMTRYLEQRGFQTYVFQGELEDLRHHLSKGRPLVVCLNQGGHDTLHYVVVAGVEGDFVAINDPADRKLRKVDRRSFLRSWAAAGNWTLLAVPRSKR